MVTRDDLQRFGHAAFGEKWQSPLARSLMIISDRSVPQGLVANWVSGQRAIPSWVGETLLKFAVIRGGLMRDEADKLDLYAADLRERMANAAKAGGVR